MSEMMIMIFFHMLCLCCNLKNCFYCQWLTVIYVTTSLFVDLKWIKSYELWSRKYETAVNMRLKYIEPWPPKIRYSHFPSESTVPIPKFNTELFCVLLYESNVKAETCSFFGSEIPNLINNIITNLSPIIIFRVSTENIL